MRTAHCRLGIMLRQTTESRCARCVEPSHDGGVEARGTQRTVAGRGAREKPLGCPAARLRAHGARQRCLVQANRIQSHLCIVAAPALGPLRCARGRPFLVSQSFPAYVFPGKFNYFPNLSESIFFRFRDASASTAPALRAVYDPIPSYTSSTRTRPHLTRIGNERRMRTCNGRNL